MRPRWQFHGLMLTVLLLSRPPPAASPSADTGRDAERRCNPRLWPCLTVKGFAIYCHGSDGVIDKKPSLKPDAPRRLSQSWPPQPRISAIVPRRP